MPIEIEQNQEHITWSLQLPCVFVTVFSQTSLFLVLIYRELPVPTRAHRPIKISLTKTNSTR